MFYQGIEYVARKRVVGMSFGWLVAGSIDRLDGYVGVRCGLFMRRCVGLVADRFLIGRGWLCSICRER